MGWRLSHSSVFASKCKLIFAVPIMNDLDWMVTHHFQEAIRYECDWAFAFDHGVCVTAACLWRLLDNGRIRVTSQDDGHRFGLPATVDCVFEVNKRLAGAICTAIRLLEGTLDLEIKFASEHVLQLIPDSSGYEAWSVSDKSRQYIAVGGGDLFVIGSEEVRP